MNTDPKRDVTPDELVRVIMGDTTEVSPEDTAYLEEMKAHVEAEVLEIYERVKAELEQEDEEEPDKNL